MLSILICVYNTEVGYLSECLSSIRDSTLSDYEICLLDDGSDIDYSELVKRFGVKYKRTANRGIFLARLAAKEMAEGEYIAFVDSDDTVTFNYHQPMVRAAKSGDADIVMNDWAFHTESTRYFCASDPTVSNDIFAEGEDVMHRFLENSGGVHAYFVLWNKVYRRELLAKAQRELLKIAKERPRYNYSEDALINFFVFKYARKLENLHTGYYFYRLHSSQSVNVISRERLVMHIDCMSYTLGIMKKNLAEYARSKELCGFVDEWAAMMSRTHYSYARAGGHTDLYPYIMERYEVTRLSLSTLRDARANLRNVPLPDNFTEIENALKIVAKAKSPTRVKIFGDHSYISRTLAALSDSGHEIVLTRDRDENSVIVPKPLSSLKKRILYSPIVYKTGMLLFKKGSKLRALLKKKL